MNTQARCLSLGLLFVLAVSVQAHAEDRIDYNRDIRPILSDNCYKCHGPDGNQRQADLRLDVASIVGHRLESGGTLIKAQAASESVLFERVSSKDPDELMPPRDSGNSLTAREIVLLKRWIDQGAEWKGHWAFQTPVQPVVPGVERKGWQANPIDAFVLARLQQKKLEPSPEATRETLIRRVSYDLTGLPPSLDEIDHFLADQKPGAYARVVDRLLKSSRYGEHMSRFWLDAARYGDTHGLHLDNERSIWPYRDWVIKAFNANMPFDQFTVEQLAGDLLPNPSLSQLVATGFNRCNVTTSEGGAIADEYRFKYGVDRVETTSTVWLGLTMGCVVCHEHKFDPIPLEEFYKFLAYFNSLTEKAMDGNALLPPPTLKVPSIEQEKELAQLRTAIGRTRSTIDKLLEAVAYKDPGQQKEVKSAKARQVVWIDDTPPAGAKVMASGDGGTRWAWVGGSDHPVHSGKLSSYRKSAGLGQHFFTGAKNGLTVAAGDTLFAWVHLDIVDPPQQIMLQFNDGTWEHRAYWGKDRIPWGRANTVSRRRRGDLPARGEWVRLEVPVEQVGLKPGAVINGWAFTQFGGAVHWDTAGIVTTNGLGQRRWESLAAWTSSVAKSSAGIPKDVATAARTASDKRSAQQAQLLRRHFLVHACRQTTKTFAPRLKSLAAAEARVVAINKALPSTLVMRDMPKPRQTYVLKRGQYDMPDKTRPVQPDVPAMLPRPRGDAPPNRLGLARWLVQPDHPLTSRVTVNRIWQQYFGTGLVRTAEDFGSQGEWPSHPRLIDWLATEFIRSGWDVKALHRLIVSSATYRQSSAFRARGQEADPENRLLWRGPRYRLDAEMLRDGALAIGGLLVERLGGKSVRPYQPDGLWRAVGYSGSNTVKFVQDHGQALYRRSMYTFWKRTAAPPTMLTFDAPSRESCVVRRARTNTPLQALLLLNDVQFVESARGMAQRILSEPGSDKHRLVRGFRMVTARRPRPAELRILAETLALHRREYRDNPEAATRLLAVGEAKISKGVDAGELAAWTVLSNLLLNLDEAISKS